MDEQFEKLISACGNFAGLAEATSIFEDVNKEIAEERQGIVLDLSNLENAEDWSVLANQVVGFEFSECV